MTPEEAHAALDRMLDAAKGYIDAGPVAVTVLYPGGEFVQGGKKGRNREETSRAYIRLAAEELQGVEK